MTATIDYERFDRVRAESLERFLPIAELFSHAWGKDIVMDHPHGQARETEDVKGKVYIHVFSHPPDFEYVLTASSRLFGFDLSQSGLAFKPDPQRGRIVTGGDDIGARFHCIKKESDMEALGVLKIETPNEKVHIGYVYNDHIYISFDLACYPWDCDRVIFWIILDLASEYVALDSQDHLMARSIEAHRDARDVALNHDEGDLLDEVSALSLSPLTRELARLARELEEQLDLYREHDRASFDIDVRTERIHGLLEKPQEPFTDKDLEEDFETILNMAGVLGVEIDDQLRKMIVHTAPLILTPPVLGGSYQLSQHRIEIDFGDPVPEVINSIKKLNGLTIKEEGWIAPYLHPQTVPGNVHPCLGNDMFYSLCKSTADHDYPGTIALILTFLTLDDAIGIKREGQTWSDDVPPTAEEEYRESLFYDSEEKLADARTRYVRYAKKHRTLVSEESLKSELDGYAKEADGHIREFLAAREKAQHLQEQVKSLKGNIASMDCQDSLADLLAIEELSMLFVGESVISAVFAPGYGKKEGDYLLFGSLWIAIDTNSGRVIIPKKDGGYVPHRSSDIVNVSSEFVKHIKSLVARGHAIAALKTTFDYLRGEDRDMCLGKPKPVQGAMDVWK